MYETPELVSAALVFLLRFDSIWMEFLQWLNKFEFIADFLYVTDDKKVEFLLNMVEPWVFADIKTQVAHSDSFNIPYELLICVFEQMFSRIPQKFSAKYRFNYRDQLFCESVKHYANSLEKLLNRCGSDINTKDNLVKRCINGLINMDSKSELLKRKRDITLDEALAIAQEFENKEWKKYKLKINSN